MGFLTFTLIEYLNSAYPDDAVQFYRRTIAQIRPGDYPYTVYQASLGTALSRRFRSSVGTPQDLDEAITCYREASAHCPKGGGQHIRHLDQLAVLLWDRFKLANRTEDMEDAVQLFQTVLDARPPGHPYRFTSVMNLARTLVVRRVELERQDDEATVWRLYGELLTSHQPSPISRIFFQCREMLQMDLASDIFACLHYSPVLIPTSPLELLTQLISSVSQVLKDTVSTVPDLMPENLTAEQLNSHIPRLHNFLDSNPPPHPERHVYAGSLGNAYTLSFSQFGDNSDLEKSITHFREAVDQCPSDHFMRLPHLTNLATALRTRYSQLGRTDDLNEAIEHFGEAHDLSPPGHKERPVTTMNLANILVVRYGNGGSIQDLDQALTQLRDTLPLLPQDHPLQCSFLNSIAVNLGARHGALGEEKDIEDAIVYLRSALALSTSSPGRMLTLQNLSTALITRFGSRNRMNDVEEAIVYLREAVSLCPIGSPDRHAFLINLASTIETRFEILTLTPDIDEAIFLYRQALDMCPAGHVNRAASLDNLGSALHNRYRFNGAKDLSDLEESITHRKEAILIYRPNNPMLSGVLESLATVMHDRFSNLREAGDMDMVIELHNEALSLRPTGHPGRFLVLLNLGNALRERYVSKQNAQDLRDAITHYSEAETLVPADWSVQLTIKMGLASSFLDRASAMSMKDGVDEAFVLFELAANHHNAQSQEQLGAALRWVHAARHHGHHSLLSAYSRALALLDRSLVIHPTIEAQQKFLAAYPKSLATDAASTAITEGNLELAIELLEQGRGVLWSRMSGYRHPLEKLRRLNEGLAIRFEALSTQLEQHATVSDLSSTHPNLGASKDFGTGLPPATELRIRKQRLAFEEWERTVASIRRIDGFADFLQVVPFSTLRKAVVEGPVIVVNISEHRSDAIIVRHVDPPVLIPLPNATPIAIGELASHLQKAINRNNATMSYPARMTTLIRVLRALWEHVVSPIKEKLDELGIQEGSRIWWCPTAELCSLPIHAAGRYRPGEKNLPDLYISSYVPTLASLIRSREGTVTASKPELAVVALLDDSLPMVQEEIDRIEQSVPSATLLAGDKANREEVLSALRTHSWAHFACHGALRSQPFQSLFELQNGETLTLLDIVKARLPRAEFAFLSACHTAAAQDAGTPDEVIHLASALQFSGFRSVVGTLWEIIDDDAPEVAGEFYRHVVGSKAEGEAEGGGMDYRNSARALNLSVNRLRSQQGMTPDRWVPFVHVGA
ncbi:hypothetical protein Hypma_006302 [Hypsizygus marmoreus]|uniref:CHAT domain-containing protein n=1 Tax=Hypsizygus marmoreus TaxID=39966 RepID=A0A369JXK8_HYPMA|nr:hypothetical protein Hypma_006302 [Hypsizygus marmoreus]